MESGHSALETLKSCLPHLMRYHPFLLQVLGVLAMIDSNETDYKVVVINVNDPRAGSYYNISDIPQVSSCKS